MVKHIRLLLVVFLLKINVSLAAPVGIFSDKDYNIYTNRTEEVNLTCVYSTNLNVKDFQIIKKRNLMIENIDVTTLVDDKICTRIFNLKYRALKKGYSAIEEINLIYENYNGETEVIKYFKPVFGRAKRYIGWYFYVLSFLLLCAIVLSILYIKKRKITKGVQYEQEREIDEVNELEKFLINGKIKELYEYLYNSFFEHLHARLALDYKANYREMLLELEKRGLDEEKNFLIQLREIIFSRNYGDRFKQRHFANKYLELIQEKKEEREENNERTGDK